jgi:hypothetical protein
MVRKIAIGLAAAAIATAGSTLSASAIHGAAGGGLRAGAAGGPHVSASYGRPSMAGHGYAKGPRAYAFEGRGRDYRSGYGRPHYGYRYDHYRRYPYRYGYSRPYAYGGSCWTRMWTPYGWQSKYVCGYEHPSYGYRHGYERPYYRYGHYRPFYGHRYGGYGHPYGRR